MSTTKINTFAQLRKLAERTKSELAEVDARIDDIVSTGGEPNVIIKIKRNNVELPIADKTVNISVPVNVSELTNDSKYQTDAEVAAAIAAADHMKRKIVNSTSDIDLTAADASQYIYMVKKSSVGTSDKYDEYMVIDGALEKVGDWEVDLSNYVEKETGKGLSTNDFTTELLNKLNGIEDEANKYVHPTNTAHALGFYKVTVDALGHVTAAAAVTKKDITDLGIPSAATVVSASSTNGKLTVDDTEITVYVLPDTVLQEANLATDAEVETMLDDVFGAQSGS